MESITVQDFQLLQKDSLTILDTRDQEIYDKDHINGALSFPITTLPNRLNELNNSTTYYIISQTGRRSEVITEFLNQQGIDAVNVIGGMNAYKHYLATLKVKS